MGSPILLLLAFEEPNFTLSALFTFLVVFCLFKTLKRGFFAKFYLLLVFFIES